MKNVAPIAVFIIGLFLIGTSLGAAGHIICVDDDATGANDGSSWESAYVNLQDALANANNAEKPAEIRVAQGVYRPDQGANQTPRDQAATFQLINDVALKGGYAGSCEADPNARDIELYETILTGDLGGDDADVNDTADLLNESSRIDNSYHVVTASGTNSTAVLDGFTITAGNDDRYDSKPWEECPAHGRGGGMYNQSGSPTVVHCKFRLNSSQWGGAMYSNNGDVALIDCTFADNCSFDGGGIFSYDSSPTLTNCAFTRNRAVGGLIAGVAGAHTPGQGGAMYNYAGPSGASRATLTGCRFSDNLASQGGGMFNAAHYYGQCNAALTDCVFSRNRVIADPLDRTGYTGGQGGGMYNSNSTSILTGCEFTGNSAAGMYARGGGVCNGSGIHGTTSSTIMDSLFSGNSVTGTNADGGGVYNASSTGDAAIGPTVINCRFIGNSATGMGGGMFNESGTGSASATVSVSNCTFTDNSAGCGGGLCIRSGTGDATMSAAVTSCWFYGNSASSLGGGMFNGSGTGSASAKVAVAKCVFSANWAYCGGGMCNEGGTGDATLNVTVKESVFSANAAVNRGGGMSNESATGSATAAVRVANCIFSGNSAPCGGGMANSSQMSYATISSTVVNCTFSGNSARRGSGMYNKEGEGKYSTITAVTAVKVTNCILRNGGDEICRENDPVVNVTYSNLAGGWPGEGNIDVDPCFMEPGYWDPNGTPEDPNDDFWVDGDYHLKSQAGRWEPSDNFKFQIPNSKLANATWVQDDVTSPCIDAGDPMSPIGQESFPNGGRINMGAYGGRAEASKSYFGEPVCETIVAGDINGDCNVDFTDFEILALHWLLCGAYLVNTPPAVTITEPANGVVSYCPAPITINADASDVDGFVIKVNFIGQWRSNSRLETISETDTDGTDGWKTVWFWWHMYDFEADLTIWAEAIDNDGAKTVSPEVMISLRCLE